MPSAYETAYPRLKSNPSATELDSVYTPSKEENKLARQVARSETARLGFLVLLKTFQRLGYFIQLHEVPQAIIEHIARGQGFLVAPLNLHEYDASGTRRRHIPIIRSIQHVKPFGPDGQDVLRRAVREAAQTLSCGFTPIKVTIMRRTASKLPTGVLGWTACPLG